MDRRELLAEIDLAFESYADNEEMSAENLRSRVRILVAQFCDEMVDKIKDINATLDEVMS